MRLNAVHFSDFILFWFQEKLALRQQLNEAKQQLLQQAEYCTELGAAACTILWGVSSSEEVVKAILGGVSTPRAGWTLDSCLCNVEGTVPLFGRLQTRPFCFACQVLLESQLCRACGNLDPGVCQMKGVSSLLSQSRYGVVEVALRQDRNLTSVNV